MNNKTNTTIPQQSSSQDQDDEVDLLQLIHTVWHGKWLILFFTLVSTLLAFIYAFGQTPIYKADSMLQVESQKAAIPGIEDIAGLGGDDTSVGTELEIIKSRKILGQAVKNLKLDISAQPKKVPLFGNLFKKYFSPNDTNKPPLIWDKFDDYIHPYAWGNERIKIESLNTPNEWLNKTLILTKAGDEKFKMFLNDKLLIKGKIGQPSSSKNGLFSIFVSELSGVPGTQFSATKLSKLKATENLQKTIQASEKGKKTGIISLALEGKDKKRIVETLDFISKTYLEQNKSRSSEEASNALKFLEEQIKPVKQNADNAEAGLKQYRTQNQTADMSMETQAVLDVVAGIETELQTLSLKKDELNQKFTDNHPTIQAITTQQNKLLKRKDNTLAKISKLPETQQKLLKLESDYRVANTIYIDLLNKIQEFKIAKASSVGNAYIVDTAVVYDLPVKPKKGLILALGVLLGGMLGVITVFLKKALHRTVDSPEKIEEALGLPVYATVPISAGVKLTGSLSNKNRKQKSLLALENPTDPAIESLRSLRTSLHFALLEAKNNIVMITGPSPSIGKSFISSNFAAVLATGEQRILLIDADMRKGYLHKLLNQKVSPGLSDLISENASIDEAIHTVAVGNDKMDIITRGKTPPNPSELLMHSNFEKLLNKFSESYDLILIDTPPVHAVTDPTIIGKHSGVVFMVARSEHHSMKEIEYAVTRLSQTGIETKGFIFNGYNPKKSTYGYGGYGYSYYGEYKSDK